MKKCINCFQMKKLDEFYRKLQGHQSWCKECAPEVQKAWRKRKFQKQFSSWARDISDYETMPTFKELSKIIDKFEVSNEQTISK